MKSWAEKAIAKYERKDDWGIECVSSTEVQYLLLKEHARSVRIVKRRIAALKKLRDLPEEMYERWVDIAGERWRLQGLIDELGIILAALTKGRGKGRK